MGLRVINMQYMGACFQKQKKVIRKIIPFLRWIDRTWSCEVEGRSDTERNDKLQHLSVSRSYIPSKVVFFLTGRNRRNPIRSQLMSKCNY